MKQFWLRYREATIISVVVLVALVLLYMLRSVVFPFLIGLILAYILLPIVSWIERRISWNDRHRDTKRTIAVVSIFLVGMAVFAVVAFYLVSAVLHSLSALIQRAPEYTISALTNQFLTPLQALVPEQYRDQVAKVIDTLGNMMGTAVKDTFSKGVAQIPSTIGFVVSFFSMPFFLFYVLKDWRSLQSGFRKSVPPWAQDHSRNIFNILGTVAGKYIRAQLFLGLVVGTFDYIGLLIFQAPLAPVLALLGGATEMVPFIGPWIGTITAAMVMLVFAPEKAVWIVIWFGGVQLLENTILVPRIQGGQMNIHPAVAMVLLVVGTFIAGFWGLLFVMPLTATITQLVRYMSAYSRSPQLVFTDSSRGPPGEFGYGTQVPQVQPENPDPKSEDSP